MKKAILVYLQIEEGKIAQVSYELIGKAYKLSKKTSYDINTISIGNKEDHILELLSGLPINKIFHYKTKSLYNIGMYARIITALCEQIKPEIFLIGGTMEGRFLAPFIATNLKAGLTADCTELDIDNDNRLLQIRPAFGEKILAHIKTSSALQMATVRAGVMEASEKIYNSSPKIFIETVEAEEGFYQIEEVEWTNSKRSIDISKEKVLVVLGGGLTKKKDIPIWESWAKSIGAGIACSRKLVERNWFKPEHQVGLSGHSVNADLMITIGVSGSVQFQAGIKKVGKLISVNTDRQAPIFGIAHIPLILDLDLILQKLKECNYG